MVKRRIGTRPNKKVDNFIRDLRKRFYIRTTYLPFFTLSSQVVDQTPFTLMSHKVPKEHEVLVRTYKSE
jgi:hypothetical protein